MYLTTSCPHHRMDQTHLERCCSVEVVQIASAGNKRKGRCAGVRLSHPASGLIVVSARRRSLAQNRADAFEKMRVELERLNRDLLNSNDRGGVLLAAADASASALLKRSR